MLKKARVIIVMLSSFFAFGLYFFYMNKTEAKKKVENVLRISFSSDVFDLDPVKMYDVVSCQLAKHLHEGLMRSTDSWKLEHGIAESVQISEDQMEYRFKLKDTFWSDGTPLTAHDFVRSWKRAILDPLCMYSFRFDVIKGVKQFRNSKNWDAVQIKALSDHILFVELEKPIPYFLQWMACPHFFPVHDKFIDMKISNGPFLLTKMVRDQEIEIEKNQYFWGKSNVSLEKINIAIVEDPESRLSMWFGGELDLIGGVMSPITTEEIEGIKVKGLSTFEYDIASVYMLCVNVNDKILQSKKIRKALSMSIDRNQFASIIYKNSIPAFFYVPFVISGREDNFLIEDKEQARKLFSEGIEELGIEKKDISIKFLCSVFGSKFAQAIQAQWKEVLEIDVVIELLEFKSLMSRLNSGDYMISSIGSIADYPDPNTFFENFYSGDNVGNYSGWSNKEFDLLFERSFFCKGEERKNIMNNMEDILLEDLPVIPLCFCKEVILTNDKLTDFSVSITRLVDFSKARFIKK